MLRMPREDPPLRLRLDSHPRAARRDSCDLRADGQRQPHGRGAHRRCEAHAHALLLVDAGDDAVHGRVRARWHLRIGRQPAQLAERVPQVPLPPPLRLRLRAPRRIAPAAVARTKAARAAAASRRRAAAGLVPPPLPLGQRPSRLLLEEDLLGRRIKLGASGAAETG